MSWLACRRGGKGDRSACIDPPSPPLRRSRALLVFAPPRLCHHARGWLHLDFTERPTNHRGDPAEMGTRKRREKHPGLYLRGRYWWLRHDPVTGRAESTRCTDLDAARAYQAQRERQALDPSYAAPKLGEQCARFIERQVSAGVAPA